MNKNEHEVKIVTYSNIVKKTGRALGKTLKVFSLGFLLLLATGLLILAFWALSMYFKYSKEFEAVKPQSNSTQLVMYDATGNEIFRGFGAAEPDRVELSNIPETIRNATLAAEDIDFYNHGPLDLKGIGRAIYLNWQDSESVGIAKVAGLLSEGNYSQGGSTITQQLVKNIYLTNEKSFDRKIKEAVFAYKLEDKYSKDQILELYLNEIYYGEQALGIKNAAKIYYNKEISELSLAETSMLTGLPQAPTKYSPINGDEEQAKKRQEYVLQKMYLGGMIDLDTAKEAANAPLEYYGKSITTDKYPYFSQFVKEELTGKLGAEIVEDAGIKVYTSLDPVKQTIAEARMAENLKKLSYRGASNAAVVIGDVASNSILAMVGGADWSKSKVNVSTSLRQPGSSFKPIVYATALENGYTAASVLNDKYTNYGGIPAYAPRNYSGYFSGYVTLRNALARSLNTTAVSLGQAVGLDKVIATAHNLGITSLNNEPSSYGLPLSLGSGEVKLVDMVEAFSTFADNGKRMPQTAIARVVGSNDEEIALPKRNKSQVIGAETAYIISSILSDNKARSATFGTYSPLKTAKTTAVKTGTTDNYADSWTLGYSPDFVVGVWMGNNDRTPMRQVSGVEGAAYVWHDVMTDILANTADKAFTKPDTIEEAWINPYTGKVATYKGGANILEYFKLGTVPK
jgi:1A family penicillin-binding protein